MSEGTPAPSGSTWRRAGDAARANPTAVAIGVYVLTAIVALCVAYTGIFSVFAFYDDEGTLLTTLKAFVGGHPLYHDIWSVYGPFYYEVFGAFFKLTGLDVTTDASRTIVIFVWVGTSLLLGLGAHLLTGRLSLGVSAMIASFSALVVLASEPMHPQGLCILLIAAFVLALAGGLRGRTGWTGAVCGALLGALLLTKVNLGIYAIAAVVAAAAVAIEPVHRRGWLRLLVFLAFLALPFVVLYRDLDQNWVREFFLIELFAVAAVLVAARPLWPGAGEDDGGTGRWLLAATAGFAVAVVAILVAILLTGPSPTDVYDGVIKDALSIRDVLSSELPFPPGAAVVWAVAAGSAAVVAVRLRLAGADAVSPWPGLLRGLAGLVILFSVIKIAPFRLGPSAQDPVIVPMLLAWVAVLPPRGAGEAPFKRFVRVLLPALAIAETLQVYPVSGSQMGIAATVFIPVGAVCLGDAASELRTWSAAREPAVQRNFGLLAPVALVALPALLALLVLVLPGATNVHNYREGQKLPLPGAELMRLPAGTVETYTSVVDFLHRHGCTTFVGLPNSPSFYLWAELEAPLPTIPNAWPKALTRAQQEQAVSELRTSPKPCAFEDQELANVYLPEGAPTGAPLVEYVERNFRQVDEVGPFRLELPKPSATVR